MIRLLPFAATLFCAVSGLVDAAPGSFAGDEFRINTHEANDQRVPLLASHQSGNTLVVWQSRNQAAAGWDIFARALSASGQAQGDEFQVNVFTGGRQDGQHLAALPEGDFVVAWNGGDRSGASHGIHARRFTSSGMPISADLPIGGMSEDLQILPRIAGAPNGGFLVVWEGRGIFDDTLSIHGRFMSSDGTPSGAIERISQYQNTNQRRVDLARNADGRYMIVWQSSEQDGESWGIFGRCLTADGDGGGEFQINQSIDGAQSQPRVVGLGDRGFAVAWHDNAGRSSFEYRRIMLRHFDRHCDPLGDELQVNQFDEGIQDLPAIGAGPDGSHIVVWQSLPEDFKLQGIYARRLDASGAFHGDPFRVSQEAEAFQDFPDVDMLPDGGFYVVWESIGQDESGFGIYGRRFDGPTAAILTAVSGGNQVTEVGRAFPEPLVVRVSDQWGQPLGGQWVQFVSQEAGAGGLFANGQPAESATTDADGLAVVEVQANDVAGQHEVLARTGEGGIEVRFQLENRGIPALAPIAVPAASGPAWLVLVAGLLLIGLIWTKAATAAGNRPF
ncbi:MAG: hypothetical protein HND55_01680 [Pseudomonadota bacterium]|nr:MAG: hypothetical protein HND55_01680 [Pseudomonadota bacterium]